MASGKITKGINNIRSVNMSNLGTILNELPVLTTVCIFCDTDVCATAFGLTGRSGAGLVIKHNSDLCDLIFFDLNTYITRYDITTGQFSRKAKIDAVMF